MGEGTRWAILVLGCYVLWACSSPSTSQTDTPRTQTSSQKATHVYSDQVQALDKAKNLSRTLQKTENVRQRQLQE